jgi:UDP-N-acetyl-D-mannosaminuronate dehydrogenase
MNKFTKLPTSPPTFLIRTLRRRGRIGDAKEKNPRRNQPILDNRQEIVIKSSRKGAKIWRKMNNLTNLPTSPPSTDCVLIATNHDDFDYEMIKANAKIIVDTRGVYREPADHIVRA